MLSDAIVLAAVARCMLFRGADAEAIAPLFRHFKVGAGESIAAREDIIVVATGVAVRQMHAYGRTRLEIFGPGDGFGEELVLGPYAPAVAAHALFAVDALAFPADLFAKALVHSPTLAYNLAAHVFERSQRLLG